MNKKRVTYTMFVEIETQDDFEALELAAELPLEDFIFLGAEVEDIKD